MPKVSFSQYSVYATCPRQYKHSYVDKLGTYSDSIHTIFGTALHNTIQEYLTVFYNVSKKSANELNLTKLLLDYLTKEFVASRDKQSGINPCTQEELEEFFGDGRRILSWLVKHIDKFYTKTGYRLVGVEVPLNFEIKPGVEFTAFIDIVLEEIGSGEILIIDLKSSTRGWNKYQKEDKIKNSQVLLYKKFYSDLYNVPLQKIRVEFQILKRKLQEDSPYPMPHVSKHVPANGKPSVMKSYDEFMNFIDTVFDETGQRRVDIPYPKIPGKGRKNCRFCEFFSRGICDGNE